VVLGQKAYENGCKNGIPDEAWETIKRNPVLLKAPITTPQGGGYKSLNVTIRKALGLYANVRPNRAYAPYVRTHFPKMDLVIIRENEEDLYAGIEHQLTPSSTQALKLISAEGCEAIVRYAFEYARSNGRKKVTCMTKDNIMKQTDGLFRKTFERIATEYPDIENEHWIIDIGMAKTAANPEGFDVIVTLNLYGDIISDVAAEVAGSVGVGGSANIGHRYAMFEAVHGSAPTIAGQDIANPSGLLNAAVMMLVHLGQTDVAAKIQNAWLKTLEDGYHTGEIFREGISTERVGTQRFAQEVIKRLGQMPQKLEPVKFAQAPNLNHQPIARPEADKCCVGVDVFIQARRSPEELGSFMETIATSDLKFHSLGNRGIKVYPAISDAVQCGDLYRAQFLAPEGRCVSHAQIVSLLSELAKAHIDFVQVINLNNFNGVRGYSINQGA